MWFGHLLIIDFKEYGENGLRPNREKLKRLSRTELCPKHMGIKVYQQLQNNTNILQSSFAYFFGAQQESFIQRNMEEYTA